MNKFFRFYNQNRYMVWIIILSIAAFIALIQILDNFAFTATSIINFEYKSKANTIPEYSKWPRGCLSFHPSRATLGATLGGFL